MTDQQIQPNDVYTDACRKHFKIAQSILTSEQYSKALDDGRIEFAKVRKEEAGAIDIMSKLRRALNLPMTRAVKKVTGWSTFEIQKQERESSGGSKYHKPNYKKYASGKKRKVKEDREYNSECGLWETVI